MRKVNKLSRALRHHNSGAQSNSYFSQIKQTLSQIFTKNKINSFSVDHQDQRYTGYSLPSQTQHRKSFGITSLKKYMTHAGILSVGVFTIMSNTCFGNYCNSLYTMPKTAASAQIPNSDLIEIAIDSGESTSDILNQDKVNQMASTLTDYTTSDNKKQEINQAIQANQDNVKQDFAIIQDSYLDKVNSPVTEVSDAPRKKIVLHLVKAGESLSSIADKYQISNDTIRWSNGMDNSGILIEGQELIIMPTDGIYYTVGDGETLSSISEKYKSSLDDIRNWNNLSSDDVTIGQKIMLPGGKVPPPPKPVVPVYDVPNNDYSYTPVTDSNSSPLAGSGQFGWPTSGMAISQYFGSTSFNPWHTGIDLDSRSGWDIFASDSGTVTTAAWGWGGGYGNHVIIDHGNGYQTLYGHLSGLDVSAGQSVSQGQRIGTMGSTGWSTGPHLHFEIRYNGSFLNPLNYL